MREHINKVKNFGQFLNENKSINNRIDNALDWMNRYKIKVSDKTFQDYIDFTNKNLSKIENLINQINNIGYIWTSDLPMFFTSTMDDLGKSNVGLMKIKIYKQKIQIFYKYTHVGNSPYEMITDRYKVIYKNDSRDVTDEITNQELMELLEKNVIMTEHGIVALSYNAVKDYIKNL